MVEANIVEATYKQTKGMLQGSGANQADCGITGSPIKGKLDPHWTGLWEVEEIKEPE